MPERIQTPTKKGSELASALILTNNENWLLVQKGAEKLSHFPEEKNALDKLVDLTTNFNGIAPLRKTALKSLNNFNQPELEDVYQKIIKNPLEDRMFIQQAKNNLDNFLKRKTGKEK